MATRKKKVTRKKASRRKSASLAGIEFELPRNLEDFRKSVQANLTRLEKEVERGSVWARRRAARLLREASHQLGRVEEKGEAGWRRLAEPYRNDLVRLLRRLERAVRPPARKAARKTTRKTTRKTARKTKTTPAAPSAD
jgi:hypothetical protein